MTKEFELTNGTILVSTEAPGGIYNSNQLKAIANISDQGAAIVKATEDQRLALFVTKENYDAVVKELQEEGLGIRNYQDGLHQPTSCIGEMCPKHVQDALGSSMSISEILGEFELQGQLKIGINGCDTCCVPTHTLDISIVGEDAGYKIYMGGKNSQIPEMASFIAEGVPKDELPRLLKEICELYKEKKEGDESLADLIERTGASEFAKILHPYSQDAHFSDDDDLLGGVGENDAESSMSDLSIESGETENHESSDQSPEIEDEALEMEDNALEVSEDVVEEIHEEKETMEQVELAGSEEIVGEELNEESSLVAENMDSVEEVEEIAVDNEVSNLDSEVGDESIGPEENREISSESEPLEIQEDEIETLKDDVLEEENVGEQNDKEIIVDDSEIMNIEEEEFGEEVAIEESEPQDVLTEDSTSGESEIDEESKEELKDALELSEQESSDIGDLEEDSFEENLEEVDSFDDYESDVMDGSDDVLDVKLKDEFESEKMGKYGLNGFEIKDNGSICIEIGGGVTIEVEPQILDQEPKKSIHVGSANFVISKSSGSLVVEDSQGIKFTMPIKKVA